MAAGQLQLYGLPPPSREARPGDPRSAEDLELDLAGCGMLYAKRQGDAVLRRYHDLTFERFWKRELDIEDPAVVSGVLAEAGADAVDVFSISGGGGEGGARPDLPSR